MAKMKAFFKMTKKQKNHVGSKKRSNIGSEAIFQI